MTNIIKRLISKRSSKVKTYEYTGGGSESIPKTITHVQFHPSVTEVHDEAFKDCNKLKVVVLSDGINKIGNGSFKGCKKLKRVVLNNGLKQIGDDAFANCSIDSITFHSTITKIGDRAFAGCSSLKQIIHMTTEVDKKIKRGWDVYHGCPLIMEKYWITKIVEASHLKELEHKIDEVGSNIKLRGEYINVPTTPDEDDELKNVKKIANLIQYYEVKEATTLVELALWKSKIEQSDGDGGLNRRACRTEVPGPAKDLILQYAYRIPHHTTTSIDIYINCSRARDALLEPTRAI